MRGAGRVSALQRGKRGKGGETRLITAHGSREDGAWTGLVQPFRRRRVGGNLPCASGVVARPPSRHACHLVSFVCAPAANGLAGWVVWKSDRPGPRIEGH